MTNEPEAYQLFDIIKSATPFLAALIGAVIGGEYVKRGVLLADSKMRAAEKNAQRRKIENLRKAILAEIDAVMESYMNAVGKSLEMAPMNEPFFLVYSQVENYFLVYENNASLIGCIPDDTERELIVKGYTIAKGLRDSYRINSQLIERFDQVKAAGTTMPSGQFEIKVKTIENQLIQYVSVLKKIHHDTRNIYNTLRTRLLSPVNWKN